jgi:hypothetical protein
MSGEPQQIDVRVRTRLLDVPTLEAILHRPEGELRVTLRDDGSTPGDVAQDGLYVGHFAGDALRFVDIEVIKTGAATGEPLFRRVVLLPDARRSTIDFDLVEVEGEPVLSRTAFLPLFGDRVVADGTSALVVAFGWGGLTLAYLLLLVRRWGRR